ncbi:phage tail protein [Tardiphaga sp. vice352]|uniref:phage tail protein n=1 Tax=unclassified Tardiphaga TaxID=2631404 RepID=UPI001163C8FF|nr:MULTISPECIES: tail fiber protein [unclassified Tardiphaga]MBC7586411.1 phage tail protein [Tardiphaga sp.]QDM17224.1 phage tail protein [Tardiphaga sp. vice278]QDM22207.1 phage tail protein [Tardiphaga sp. vice154]QDM27460.1 phage tail protein [Tardiphaga sp. vice304]QDM32587.1 phage tail protein [Tardiphaga sp. vice352]
MSDPFIGEIQAFAFGFVPKGWALCDGSLLPIQRYSTLFSLIGSLYGGNGTTTFALPNLVGRVAISQGQGPGLVDYAIGDVLGSSTVSVTQQEMPAHLHPMQVGTTAATNSTPGPTGGSNVAIDPSFNGFIAPPSNTTFATSAVVPAGGSQSHPNVQPTLAIAYCIALQGVFPSFN